MEIEQNFKKADYKAHNEKQQEYNVQIFRMCFSFLKQTLSQ